MLEVMQGLKRLFPILTLISIGRPTQGDTAVVAEPGLSFEMEDVCCLPFVVELLVDEQSPDEDERVATQSLKSTTVHYHDDDDASVGPGENASCSYQC